MPLVKNTITGNNYLVKINTDGDSCSRTALRSYERQNGSEGLNGYRKFYLPWDYSPSSHTLWVFVNGEKALVEQFPTTNREYEEIDIRIIEFGASLSPTDVVEFIIVGSYLGDSPTSSLTGGITWLLTSDNNLQLQPNFGYMVDTTAQPITVNLPLTPDEGDVVVISDAGSNFDTNNTTIDAGSNNIIGSSSDYILDEKNTAVKLVFDGVDNWVIGSDATDLTSVKQDIATNATDIATNATDIATNATDISNISGGGGGMSWSVISTNTAVANNNGYIFDTVAMTGLITLTLPASPNDGDTFFVADAHSDLSGTPVTLDGNGNDIINDGTYLMNKDGMAVQFVYNGSGVWVIVSYYDPNAGGN